MDRELGGVHTDSEATRPGIEIVARQGTLPTLVEPTIRGQRERMRGDHQAAPERSSESCWSIAVPCHLVNSEMK